MKKLTGLAILNGYLVLPGVQHFYQRMKEEFASLGVDLPFKRTSDILFSVEGDGTLKSGVGSPDFILFLDKDLTSSFALQKLGYRLFNSPEAIATCDNKMLTHLSLANQGVKMPLTIAGPLNYSGEISLDFVKNLERELSFPLVAKDSYGSMGKNVFLVHDEEELIEFEKSHHSNERLYQEFIASSFGHDYRLIVIGGKFVTGMKRENKNGDFRSNIAQGASGEKIEIPETYKLFAEKTAKSLHLDYCGIDLMEGPNHEPILCEANSNAFIDGIEKVTGLNVAKTYAEYILKTLK